MDYPGGFITKTAPTLNPALGNAAPGVWRLNDVLKNIKAATWPSYDPYFENTTLLLHGNGTNGGQNNTFLDSGTANSGSGFTITRNGNTTQGTFSPFSQTGWSNYFDGTGNGYVRFADAGSVLDLSGDFTVEFWSFSPAIATTNATLNLYFSVDTLDRFQLYQTSSAVILAINSSNVINYTGSQPGLNVQNHFAVVRNGSTVTLYINGISVASGTSSYSIACTDITIGGQDRRASSQGPAYHGCNAYISNFRVVKGTAVYTSNFTPPTTPLTAISGTSLLTCQANRFVDSSTNALVATVGSGASVQAFSPFAPTAAYSASTVGGSGYFDGSGDYLNTGSNTAFALGTGDFTWETWLYRTVSATQEIYTSMTTDGLIIYISGNAAVVRRFGVADLLTSSASIDLNTWTHIAVARSGTTLSMWINGSRSAGGTTTNSTNFAQSGLRIGINDVGSSAYTGYMSNLRVVKGTAVYDPTQTSITVPTAPLTNISNTSLLLNFTNAAIIDNTAKNVLETVGSAQISTTQSKFGGASLYFDGTGDYLKYLGTVTAGFGSGNFTIEFWINAPSSNDKFILALRGGLSGGPHVTTGVMVALLLALFVGQLTQVRFYLAQQ